VPLRVLHAPTNVGNHPQTLARAERALGFESRCVTLGEPPFGYDVDEVVALPRGEIAAQAARARLLRRALREFDVVHFNFGRSIFEPPLIPMLPRSVRDLRHVPGRAYGHAVALRDVGLLRRAGKVVAVTFQGDDARQGTGPSATRLHRRLADAVGPGYYTEYEDALKRRRIAAFARHAHLLYFLNPDLEAFLPARARFVPYASVDPREWKPPPIRPLGDLPHVVHAPSHRGIKGTEHVIDAVGRLRDEGLQLRFTLVEGMGHDEARRVYESADLLVDQLLVGWYGGLAVELMALGRPVVCAIDDDVARRAVPADMLRDLPIVHATPETLADVLRGALTTGRGVYEETARRSHAYAARWHDPVRIAAQMRDDYEAALDRRSLAGTSRS
jgi:glycosyltransferase involved in cell wall biosynthesis